MFEAPPEPVPDGVIVSEKGLYTAEQHKQAVKEEYTDAKETLICLALSH